MRLTGADELAISDNSLTSRHDNEAIREQGLDRRAL